MQFPSRAWAQVNLDAIANNIRELKRTVGEDVKILASVKADAYGHGFFEVAKTFLANGADILGVAFIDEALQLRQSGFDCPIMILGHTPNEFVETLIRENITPTVISREFAEALSNVVQSLGKRVKIHIKVDTGMSRVGFVYNDSGETRAETIAEILAIADLPNIEIEGIFTHFARADESDGTFTELQLKRFLDLTDKLERQGLNIPIKHAANSAAAIAFSKTCLNMVRAGIAAYGIYPSVEMKSALKLVPAMEFRAKVTQVKWLAAGEPISYGGTFVTQAPTKVATIPVGYADGVFRVLSNRGFVIVDGKKVPIIGNICMDQCMIDVTSVNNIDVGGEVLIFGGDNLNSGMPVEEVAKICGTISYEILCAVGKRVPRVYTRGGKIVKLLNYLLEP